MGAGRAHLPPDLNLLTKNEAPMTKQRTPPSAEERKGSVKEAIGKLTGDARTETEGRRQKHEARSPKASEPRGGD
ncbi:CsbD family protein [Methylobacterium radiodurans]|nr:CsbD family protein [Methylobacterium radiodurans]